MALPQEKCYSMADVLDWDGQERIELVDGYPVMMAPPARIHQRACMALAGQLYHYLKGKKCEVYPAPFAVRLFEREGDYPEDVYTMVEPDISVVCDCSKLDAAGCKGAPDLVMEILSPSTMRHDRFTKFNLYQRAGVREYWIVEPETQTVQVYPLENGILQPRAFYGAGDVAKVNVLDGCFVELGKVFTE